jgi:hypothetical protein
MSFSDYVRRRTKQVEGQAEELARGTFVALMTAVVRDTPVDTGRLRGNWQCSQDSSAEGVLDRKGEAGPIGEIHAKIQAPGVYWLTNNLPYAHRIEFDGWSHTKAPAGMLRINVRRFKSILRRRGFSVT